MIYIRTTAYNASGTLERTIKSVLNQTYGEFVYYLIENGSTDNGKTKKIIQKYAEQDNRIRAFYNKKNHVWDENIEANQIIHNMNDDDFYCSLDADDEYDVSFLEKMTGFIYENDLDIAACGSDFINAAENRVIGQRVIKDKLIIWGEGFKTNFTQYHMFMRTEWGKLFKGCTLKNTIIDINSPDIPKSYGNDTFFTTCAFNDAKRIGVLPEILHKYYMYPKSTSYIFKSDRINCDRILYNQAVDFLNKYGDMLPENLEFINLVFINACFDTFNVIVNSNLTTLEKIKHIQEMIDCKQIENIKSQDSIRSKNHFNELRVKIVRWMFSQKEYNNFEFAKLITNIINILYIIPLKSLNDESMTFLVINNPVVILNLIADNYKDALAALKSWYKNNNRDNSLLSNLEYDIYKVLKMPDKVIFDLLIDIYYNRPSAANEINISAKIQELISKYPIFNDLSLKLICSLHTTVAYFMLEDYENAQKSFLQKADTDLEVEENEKISFYRFAQNLSAFSGDSDNYILFSKKWIEKLIDCNQTEIADIELSEFEKILSDDKDFKSLRERLNKVSG